MFGANVPARKFKSYVCTSTKAMADSAAKEVEVGDAIHVEEKGGR